MANLTYGCHLLLEPARVIVGHIIINSGFRNEAVNRKVGGVKNSQHLLDSLRPTPPLCPHRLLQMNSSLRLACPRRQTIVGFEAAGV
ncbi:MAG: hypothetical protein IKY01_10730 [Prevotella sp.]|nr:hypothetical protein [Prevotella sp.]